MPTFDLLAEPWIPVVREDGTRDEVGLRKALLDAPRIREISDPMPTVEFGLYRLLVALVMDIHELKLLADLEELLAAGEFDDAKVEAYFTRWADRFDLFHSEHPFLQTAGMEGEEKPLAALLPPMPSGTNVTHFHHGLEATFRAGPAAAARLLTTLAPFATKGGQGQPQSINGAPPWYVLITGTTLFDTVCLNCCVLPLPTARGDTPPAWRNDRPLPSGRATQASLLEALTWRPRRMQLMPGGPARCCLTGVHSPQIVHAMRFTGGVFWDGQRVTWVDPSVGYRITADGMKSQRPREGRELWRDTGPMALLREADYEAQEGKRIVRFERPAVVTQFGRLVSDGFLPRATELTLRLYGMRAKDAKTYEWQRETLSPPARLIWRSEFRSHAQDAMVRAESIAKTLLVAVEFAHSRPAKRSYTPTDHAGITNAAFDEWTRLRKTRPREVEARQRAAQSERHFWSDLRPDYDLFLKRLADLPEDGYDEALAASISAWNERLREVGRQALDDAIGDLDTDADALVRQVNARSFFRRQLHYLLLSPEEKAALNRKRPRGRKAAPIAPKKGGAEQ